MSKWERERERDRSSKGTEKRMRGNRKLVQNQIYSLKAGNGVRFLFLDSSFRLIRTIFRSPSQYHGNSLVPILVFIPTGKLHLDTAHRTRKEYDHKVYIEGEGEKIVIQMTRTQRFNDVLQLSWYIFMMFNQAFCEFRRLFDQHFQWGVKK